MNEDQLKAIIEAAVSKAVEDTKAALAPLLVAAETKNKGLLADLKKAQGKPEPADKKETIAEALARIDAETDRLIAETESTDYSALYRTKQRAPKAAPGISVDMSGALVLDREAARNPASYRAAREEAEKRGVPLRIVDASETSNAHVGTGQTDVPKRSDFVVGRSRYVHTSVVQGQLQQLHAETQRDGKRLVSFRHPDQLPNEALAVYNSPEGQK